MNHTDGNIDYNELFKLAKTASDNASPTHSDELPFIEKSILSQELRIMKSIIPYLDYNYQKQFSILVKIIEFKKTIELFDEFNGIQPQELDKKEYNMLNIITDIRNACDPDTKQKLNMFLTLLKVQNLKETTDFSNISLLNTPTPDSNTQKESDNYDGFMNLLNKVMNEKEN